MGRYRPPPPPKAPYITAQGAERLRRELAHLWSVERPEVTAQVHAAALNGDRSENGDYIYGKKRLHEIDRRVRYLKKRLEVTEIVARPPDDRDRVFFAAWVVLEDDEGDTRRVRIVGPDEFDAHPEYISVDSPVARALLGRALDDEVTVATPTGDRRLTIVEIDYDD